jgi:predicted DNA-binding protein (MmcQ/YjbR family)
MTPETARRICLSLDGSSEDMPFGPDTLVFRVATKIFALLPIEADPATMNLKCDPDRALQLREQYSGITPGYHMNKRHWNTLELSGDVPDAEIEELIAHSYGLVIHSLPRAAREALKVADVKGSTTGAAT